MKEKKPLTILRSLNLIFVGPAAILVFMIVGTIILSALYISQGHIALLIVLIALVVVLSGLYALATIFSIKALKSIFVDGLYSVTREALGDIRNGKITEARYPEGLGVKEFDVLNEDIEVTNTSLKNALMISYDLSKADIPLEHVYDDEHIVTLESFVKNLPLLIYCSQNYRNVVMEISYDFDNDSLTNEENIRLVSFIKDAFKAFPYFLISSNDDNSGYYVFIPHMNSFARIREICESMMKSISVSKKAYDGLKTIPARFSLVCYPHSNISEIFSDLRYAKRQGLPINFYLPDRITSVSRGELTQNNINLNYMTKILNSLSELRVSSKERENSLKIIERNMATAATYLSIDEVGIIYFDSNTSKASVIVHTFTNDNHVFNLHGNVDPDFLKICDENKDPDYSFYFSNRSHATINLIRMLDRYGISSGFYYVLIDRGVPRAVVFFFNRDKEMVLDSYIRESLFIFAYRISDYLLMSQNEDNYNDAYREVNALLMLSDYALYRIDPSTYKIVSYSEHFPVLFPKVKVGESCYKALYGLDSPCPQCPLKTSRKMIIDLEKNRYEVSLSLNERLVKLKRMVVHKIASTSTSSDRFDMDLLINSYPSLAIALRSAYSIHGRGYLLLLRIDNLDQLTKDVGSEGYLYILRQFIHEIKMITKYSANIFYHDQQSIAILLNECGQIDVVNLCEQIYELSKKTYSFDEYHCSFDVTYLPFNYPQAYPEAEDFLKYVYRYYINRTYEINKNFIFFPDGDYSRSASRNEFMLAVIDEQFGANTFQVVLQPIVRASNGAIYGAELFIRLSDEYRAQVFNTEELVRVAAKNGKISLISNALIKYIGELYQQYGLTIFKIFGFTRLTINTDFSYFSDPNFFDNIYELLTDYHFPRGFLGFEITETEVMNNRDRFEAISRRLISNHVALICDQYTGSSLSIEVLKNLGFEEIKIPRKYVGDVEVNKQHLNEITSILEVAKKSEMKVTFVGVENSNQYIILRDLDKNCGLQGFHFYKPLDRSTFIDVLRDNNNTK
ncbi:MAG: EAL domain-containing protein [Bacilli bacterium]|nr:EAL domain-containing protein [Bacilli bacterium]